MQSNSQEMEQIWSKYGANPKTENRQTPINKGFGDYC